MNLTYFKSMLMDVIFRKSRLYGGEKDYGKNRIKKDKAI